MTRRDVSYLLGVGAAATLTAPVVGQDAEFKAEVAVVNVLASVRDKNGHVVKDLKQEDFTVTEDGKPQEIRYFSQQSDLPLTLGLLIDTSNSQLRVLPEERRASYQFLRQVMREDRDKAFVIHFDFETELLQDLTSSKRDLEDALSDVNNTPGRRGGGGYGGRGGGRGRGGPRGGGGGGGTVLYDAVLLASDEITKKIEGRKALILLSDGDDHGSKVSLSHSIEAAQRADTLVYSILFSDMARFRASGGVIQIGPGPGGGKKVMRRYAEETGGAYYEVSNKQPIEKIYDLIDEELRNQCSLGYRSSQSGAGYRKLKVAAKRPGLVVQTRDGYYGR